ncbi:MAG: hypothetical protein ACUVTM_07155 [Candidatus Bathyarchaeia archaeon]
MGADRTYARRSAEFSSRLYVRVLFKAVTPTGFTERIGTSGEYYELPFKALKNLLDEEIYTRAAAITDSRIMPLEERNLLISRLVGIDWRLSDLEEEGIDMYVTAVCRLRVASGPGVWCKA